VDWIILAAYVGGALFVSAICSLLEAVLMSVNTMKLEAKSASGCAGSSRMLAVKARSEDAIAAILSLNTVAHTVGATLAGAQAAKMFGSGLLGVFSAVLTLLILVLTEIIPKNYGERSSEALAGQSAWVLQMIIIPVMKPVVLPSNWLVNRLFPAKEEVLSRGEVETVRKKAVEDGAIDEDEGVRMGRALQIRELPISELIIARQGMPLVTGATTLGQLAQHGEHSRHTRVLIQGSSDDEILGYLYLEEAFRSALNGRNSPETKVSDAVALDEADGALIRPVSRCYKDVPASTLLKSMLASHQQIVVVLDEDDASIEGMITLEELLEYLLDVDIRDEDDPLVSAREAAEKARSAHVRAVEASGLITGENRAD
jgi:CBS domain containing-hemolysin-like protein